MKLMSKIHKTAIILLSFAALLSASCRKSSNNNTTPVQQYQQSFDDEFNTDTHNWSFTDNVNNAGVYISGGLLNYYYHPAASGNNIVAIDFGLNVANNFALQSSISSDNIIGLAFGVSSTSNGYAFEIDQNGRYALYNEGDATNPRSVILNWAGNGAVKTNTFNTLEIDQTNGTWYGYINSIQVFAITARPIYGYRVGYIVEANTNGYADFLSARWN